MAVAIRPDRWNVADRSARWAAHFAALEIERQPCHLPSDDEARNDLSTSTIRRPAVSRTQPAKPHPESEVQLSDDCCLSGPAIAEVGRAVASQLAQLHQRGRVHGRVGLGVISIGPAGVVILADDALDCDSSGEADPSMAADVRGLWQLVRVLADRAPVCAPLARVLLTSKPTTAAAADRLLTPLADRSQLVGELFPGAAAGGAIQAGAATAGETGRVETGSVESSQLPQHGSAADQQHKSHKGASASDVPRTLSSALRSPAASVVGFVLGAIAMLLAGG